MLRGSYLLRLAACQPRTLTALRAVSTKSLAHEDTEDAKTALKREALNAEIRALKAKLGELLRLRDEDDFPRWAREHIEDANYDLIDRGEEPLGKFVLKGLLKGMRRAPERTTEEFMGKYNDPSRIILEYVWDGKKVKWVLDINLAHPDKHIPDEHTLTIDGVSTSEFEEGADQVYSSITAQTFKATPPMFWPIQLSKILHHL